MASVVRFCTQFSSVKRIARSTAARRYSSALFISGDKANENFAVLTPHLDFDDRLTDVNQLRTELALRGMNVDVDSMKKTWELYKHIDGNRSVLEEKKSEVAARMKTLSKKETLSEEEQREVAGLKISGKTIRDDLKMVKRSLWEVEDTIVPRVLKLPNLLHEDTPLRESVVSDVVGAAPIEASNATTSNVPSHVEIGTKLGLLRYANPVNYYLMNEAALFELGVLRLSSTILGESNLLRVTGCDFGRSLIVEASGLDHENPMDSFILRDDAETEKNPLNRNHLIGGASLVSFLAMHTKQLINPKQFPLRYFATGRHYVPPADETNVPSLFSVSQASVVQAFLMITDHESDEYRREFRQLVNSTRRIYDSLCDHYRVVTRSAKELKCWESLRVSFEIWSPSWKRYVEVGHISLCGEYFSKRLLIGYQTPKGRKFPSVISGNILSVPKLLGCLLERDANHFEIPPKVREHVPV